MTEATSGSADSPVVKIGVLLSQPAEKPAGQPAEEPGQQLSGELGEWLADAAAFEAAGADALWFDSGQALDPLTMAAALAAITYRSLLVTAVPGGIARPLVLTTVKRLSGGRLAVSTGLDGWPTVADQEPDLTIFRPADTTAKSFVSPEGGSWVTVPPPAGRASWRTTLAEAAERGDHGVLVPAGPRLLDILRNPGDPGGRQDLQLAQG